MIERIDEILEKTVFEPWRTACQEAERPWMATGELRKEWARMAMSSDSDVALVGGLGLARVSRQSESEFEIVENYFNNIEETRLPPDTLAMVLLSGASPPHLFLQSFLTLKLMDEGGWNDPFCWGLFSSYVRHPHSSDMPFGKMFKDGVNGKMQYLARCNPLSKIDEGAGGSWVNALQCFKNPSLRSVTGGKTEIASLAKVLRVDTDPESLYKTIDTLCLEGAIEERLFNHPVLERGMKIKTIDHLDPDSKTIDFFSGGDDVSKIWRFYNPLLLPPWMMEKLDDEKSPLLYLGKLLSGMIPLHSYTGQGRSIVGRIAAGHPFLILDFKGGRE